MSIYLLLLVLLPTTFGFLFPTPGGGCCGVPCAPPPICPTLPVCPAVQPCPPPPVAAAPAPCCDTCTTCKLKIKKNRIKRNAKILSNGTFIVNEDVLAPEPKMSIRLKRDVLDEVVKVDAKCNSEELRDIIIQNIDRVTSVAKRRIQAEAERRLEGRFNVICARGDFSYITNTELFCQETVGDVTCYVFKQLSDVVRARLS